MFDSFYIAWKYIVYNRIKTAVLIASITLISFLPFALQLLLNESERQLMSRAVTTPLVVGAKGSALDLVMNTLYFDDEVPELITLEASNRVMDTNLALPIPLYVRFRARGNPIVGTTLDYFEFRGLQVAQGRQLAVLGDCVLGAKVEEELGLKPGDSLVSSPETLFDLAGIYLLTELQPVYDFEIDHFSFWIGPELGKIVKNGVIFYAKPGFGIDGDADKGDRKFSFELGFRYFM